MRLQSLEPFPKECSLSENLFEISGLICLGSMHPNNITDTFWGGGFFFQCSCRDSGKSRVLLDISEAEDPSHRDSFNRRALNSNSTGPR